MARDDIKTSADISRVIREEVARNVITTPTNGPSYRREQNYGTTARLDMYFQTALAAAEGDAKRDEPRSAKQTDFDLMQGRSGQSRRLVEANAKARSSGKFKQVTKVSPLSEGAPA